MMRGKVLIVAGGTGGHIFPALAIARALQKNGHEVIWLGSRQGLEKQIIAPEFPLFFLDMPKVRRVGLKAKLLMPWRLLRGIWQAFVFCREQRPDLVLTMGGYVCAPAGIAAWILRQPLIIHEQNSIAGYANKLLSLFAKKILQAFPQTFHHSHKLITVGNPVRADIVNIAPPSQRFVQGHNPLRVLVLGGSQGAKAINELIINTLNNGSYSDKIELWHQSGKDHYDDLLAAYGSISARVKVDAFINDMAKAYVWADLVIARAGALTVFEIMAAGVPSLLIPYPYAVDDHQYHNAQYLGAIGAAIVERQNELNPTKLMQYFDRFINDYKQLLEMAQKARQLACPESAQRVVYECEKIMFSGAM